MRSIRWRALLLGATVGSVLVVSGCTAASAPMSEDSYLSQVRSIKTFPEGSNEELLGLGKDLCGELEKMGGIDERDAMLTEYVASVANANGSVSDAEKFVSLATRTFCVGFAAE